MVPQNLNKVNEDIMGVNKLSDAKFFKSWHFSIRNSYCISLGDFYNHKSQTFKKNKRKGF